MPEEGAIASGAGGLVKRLGNKVGPLPAWAWAAIPAGVYVMWSYYRAASSGDYVEGETALEDAPGTMDEYINTGYPNVGGGYPSSPGGSSNLPTVPSPDYTNNDWGRDAIKWLTSQGVNALSASNAVNAYIHGYPTTLNSTERKALADVIAAKGPAPHGGTIPPLTPGPTPTPTPKTPGAVRNLKVIKLSTPGLYRAQWAAGTPSGTSYVVQYQFNAGSWITAAPAASWFVDIRPPSGKGLLTVRVAAKNGTAQSPWRAFSIRTT